MRVNKALFSFVSFRVAAVVVAAALFDLLGLMLQLRQHSSSSLTGFSATLSSPARQVSEIGVHFNERAFPLEFTKLHHHLIS